MSFEHIESHATLTNNLLIDEDLSNFADVYHSPLVKLNGDEDVNFWYDPKHLSDLNNINLVFVDGPPESTCKHARYPAIPALKDKLKAEALIILDDANRNEEKEIVNRWQSEYGVDVEIKKEFDKGLAVIQWSVK